MPDPYLDPDSHPETAIQAMITRLEERGKHEAFSRMIESYVESLPSDRPFAALDLGCGTGVVTRSLARFLHPDSTIHGADVSDHLLEEGRRQCPDSKIRWDHIEPGTLPYPDNSFDVVTMHTLLSHVPDPVAVLREARRILKDDGKLIVFDADHAGTTYNQPDYETTRRIDHLLTSAIATQPDVCRQMPRLFRDSGFVLENHRADVISECGRGDYWLSSVRGFSRLIPTLGVLTPEEAGSWIDHMLKSHEEGTFFAAGAFYTFQGRPAGKMEDASARPGPSVT